MPISQSWVFQRLRLRLARNAGLQFRGSRIRLVSIALASLIVAGTVGVAAWEGFRLLAARDIPFAGGIIGILFDFLFLSLFVMLFFSSGIIATAAFTCRNGVSADHACKWPTTPVRSRPPWQLAVGISAASARSCSRTARSRLVALLPPPFMLVGFVLLPGCSIDCLLFIVN